MRENVEVAALGVGAGPRRRGAARGRRCSTRLGARRYADAPAAALAHGDERRLGVARALATEPRFVLHGRARGGAARGGGARSSRRVVRSVRDEHGAGVLLIDHNMALIMEVCDRIHVLDQGTTLAEGTPAEIRANLDVAAAYLGETRRWPRNERRSSSSDLDVRYGGVQAVRGLSFEVAARRDRRPDRRERRRQVVDAARDHGRGAGRPAATCALGDVSLRGRRPEDVARSGVALVPEGRRIFAELTVEENLRLGLAARRTRGGADGVLRSVYELFPIVEEFRGRQAGALSGGQQQQLAIARALVAEPDVLLLDEPSLGLAPTVVDVVFDALAAIRERGLGGAARRAARAAHRRRRRPLPRARERRAAR